MREQSEGSLSLAGFSHRGAQLWRRSAPAADLVVWWEKGLYAEEDEALKEIVAAFEQETGKQVELAFHRGAEQRASIGGARGRASRPTSPSASPWNYIPEWAFDDRLVDLSDAVGHFSDLFDPERSPGDAGSTRTGQSGLYGCRWVARPTTSTSGRASWSRRASPSRTSPRSGTRSGRSGATRCSRPCARPLGREDIWGVGLHVGSSGR